MPEYQEQLAAKELGIAGWESARVWFFFMYFLFGYFGSPSSFFCVHISISQSSLSTELLMSRPLNEMQNSNRLDYQSSEVPPKRRDGKFADYGIASTAPVECRCDAYAYYLGAELEVVLCREPIGMGSG